MLRRTIPLLIASLLSLATVPAHAQVESVEDRIVRQLKEQGFDEIEVTRTWLGRVRIVGTEDDTLRDIVLNPTTGAILRDYWAEIDDEDDDDRHDDDDNDDDEDGKGRGRGGDEKKEHQLLDNDDD